MLRCKPVTTCDGTATGRASVWPPANRPLVAIGPDTGWGSWQWIGADMMHELEPHFDIVPWSDARAMQCDVALAIKFLPDERALTALAQRAALIYCPVDVYGSAAEIVMDAGRLSNCHRIVVHCHRLRRHFEPYAPVVYVDHHVKFVAAVPEAPRRGGDILWVGIRDNLPPLVDWVNTHGLPADLCVLTNLDGDLAPPDARVLGFDAHVSVRVEQWSPLRHRELVAESRAAIDIKGNDFRQRHKPPAKAIDFLASGLPLAMNADSSSVEYLAGLGFRVASPHEPEHWLSCAYSEDTRRIGVVLRQRLSRQRIGQCYKRIIEDVIAERRARGSFCLQ